MRDDYLMDPSFDPACRCGFLMLALVHVIGQAYDFTGCDLRHGFRLFALSCLGAGD